MQKINHNERSGNTPKGQLIHWSISSRSDTERTAKKGFCVFVEILYNRLVIRYIKMNFVSIRAFVFTLIYIAILFVKINALENIKSSAVELSTNRMEDPVTDASIVRAPNRRNQPCLVGEKRGPNGKCRKRWWGEIKIRFFMYLNVLNKAAAHLCLLSMWSECCMRGEFGTFLLPYRFIFQITAWRTYCGVLCGIWGCHGEHCEGYDRNVINYSLFSQLCHASWYYQSLLFTNWCTIELL